MKDNNLYKTVPCLQPHFVQISHRKTSQNLGYQLCPSAFHLNQNPCTKLLHTTSINSWKYLFVSVLNDIKLLMLL